MGNLKGQVENLQKQVAGLKSDNQELAHGFKTLTAMSSEDLDAALTLARISKGTS